MADSQTQELSVSSPAIAELTTAADDKSVSGLVSSLTDLQRRKVSEDTRMEGQFNADAAKDKATREAAFKAEGVAASEIPKPWDAEKEHQKWEHNPIEGFGSAGGLFAMVASAFTKAPMENAINGMAGAINSIKEADEAGYARAFDAFKTNVKLADQRFKTQHELYNDALALGNADAAAADAKFRNAAVRFGDQKMLMLAEHGMIKEIYELQASRAQANQQMLQSAEAIDLHTIQKAAVDSIKRSPPMMDDPQQPGKQVPDNILMAAQIQRIYDGKGQYGPAEQEAIGAFMRKADKEHASTDVRIDGLIDIHQKFSAKAPNIQGYQNARQTQIEQHPEWNGNIPPDEDSKLLQQFGLTPRPSASGINAADKEKNKEEKAKIIVDGIVDGKQTPSTTGLYGLAPEVRAEAAKRGVDLEKLQLQELAAKKQIQSLNGPQMTRFVGLAQSVDNTIDEAVRLSKEMDNIGISRVNKAKLEALINLEGNSERGRLATRYLTTINTLKEEFANLANGGYAPTEPAWKLADEQINANYGTAQLTDSLKEVQRLIRYRINAIPGLSTVGPGSQNQYLQSEGRPKAEETELPPTAAKELKAGVITTFKNGQKWTIRNGKPEQVK